MNTCNETNKFFDACCRMSHNLTRMRFIFCAILMLSPVLHADPLLRLNDTQEAYPLGRYISVLEDASGKLTIDDVTRPEFRDKYQTFDVDAPSLGFSRSVFWIRLQLKNESRNNHWLLDQRFANTHYLDLYVASKDGKSWKVTQSGNLRPYANRDIPHRRIIFELPLKSEQERTIFLRLQNQTPVNLHLWIWSKPAFANFDRVESFWIGVFYGLLAVILIINLILFFYLRKARYIYLVLFIINIGGLYIFNDGYAQMFFGENIAATSRYFPPMLLSLAMVTFLYYGHSILFIATQPKIAQRLYYFLVIALSITFFMNFVTGPFFALMIILPLVLITNLFLFLVGVLSWRKQNTSARFIVLGMLFAFLSGLVQIVAQTLIVDSQSVIEETGRFTLVVLLLFMTLAIVDHMQWLQLLRERASKALSDSEQKFRFIFDQTYQMTGVLSPDGILLEINKAALAFGNQTESGELGKKFWKTAWFTHNPELQGKIHAAVKRAAAGEMVRFELDLPGPDGEQHWIDFSIKPSRDDTGRITMLIPEGRDITERKRVEEAVKESEEKFRLISEQSMLGITILQDDVFKYVNRATTQMNGYDIATMMAWKPREWLSKIIHPDDLERVIEQARKKQLGESDVIQSYTCRSLTASGETIWVEIFSGTIQYGGRPADLVTIVDISERKRAEQAINEIAAGVSAQIGDNFFQQLVMRLAKLFDVDYVFIGLVDENRMDTVDTLVVCAHGDIVDNMSYPLANTPCADVVGQETCTYPNKVQDLFPKDQLLVDMNAQSYIGTPLFNSKGAPIGLIVILDSKPLKNTVHVTEILQIFAARVAAELERSQADAQYRNAQQKLGLHVQQTPLGVIEWNRQFEVVEWNPAAEHIFGYTRDEAMGRTATDLIIPPSFQPHVDGIWQELLANKGGARSTNENTTRDGQTITCEWYNTPLVADTGEVIGVASLVADVTEKVQALKELELHRDHLEELVQERTANLETVNKELESFSYSVSHDLRAPLRAIDGFSKAVLEDYAEKLDDGGRDHLQRVRRGAQHMSELIDNMLQLSRVSRYKIQRSAVDLSALAATALSRLEESEPDRKVEQVIAAGINVEGDSHLLAIVMDNLLGNAWKYTGMTTNPGIEFGMTEQDSENVYFIKDNGVGFDMQYADKIFGAFQRLHRKEDFPGTGIGLSTVQRIIHRHGGRIWAEAAEGQGATFYFTLPGI